MHPLDWFLVAVSLSVVFCIGLYTQRYMNSVAAFLSAGRVARRYLLAVSRAELASGAVVFAAAFEVFSKSGFTLTWWTWSTGPIGVFIGVVGFVTYRYRETRVMTLAQLLEIRYNKSLRLFTGILGFLAGVVNFGIIPAVGARIMSYLFGLPQFLHIGTLRIPAFIPVMGLFLTVNVLITLTGGLLTILMTNFVEGILSQILYLALIFGLLSMFRWSQIGSVLAAQPSGKSFLNPLDSGGLQDFNIWYVAMGAVVGIYSTMAWQNRSAYNSAPLTPHEGRMGIVMGSVRGMGTSAIVTLLALCGYTYLHHPDFAAGAAEVRSQISQIANQQTRQQMEIPLALTHLLPVGLKGALCSVFLLGIFGGDSTHMHSWGSLFIQDVILPCRKEPLTPAQHIRMLRFAMLGVAVFAFLFGVFVPPSDYIQMWFAVTQGIFTTGAGAVIIGGLYWKKGTTAGAWAALIVGAILSVTGILARQFYGPAFFLNGVQVSFFCSLISLGLYVGISLLTCKEDFNLDRMLHRGVYAAIWEQVGDTVDRSVSVKKFGWGKIVGIDENFTLGDKWIASSLFAWSSFFSLLMIAGTLWNVASPWSLVTWLSFWHVVAVVIPVILAVVIGVWFTWGGIFDTLDLFHQLRAQRVNQLDNGTVVDHQNLDESVLPAAVPPKETAGNEAVTEA